MKPWASGWLFFISLLVYFIANLMTFSVVGIGVHWFMESKSPVADWIDPGGPGYRVVAVTPAYVEVQWIQMRLLLNCPGRTEVAIVGQRYASHIEAYPFLIDNERRTFARRYPIPPDLPEGRYEVRVLDLARCNPLFENRQILRVPFEWKTPHG